jgi:hypothetical protein
MSLRRKKPRLKVKPNKYGQVITLHAEHPEFGSLDIALVKVADDTQKKEKASLGVGQAGVQATAADTYEAKGGEWVAFVQGDRIPLTKKSVKDLDLDKLRKAFDIPKLVGQLASIASSTTKTEVSREQIHDVRIVPKTHIITLDEVISIDASLSQGVSLVAASSGDPEEQHKRRAITRRRPEEECTSD